MSGLSSLRSHILVYGSEYYEASDQDTTSSSTQYFGYMNNIGAWVIQQFNISGGIINYRYASGKSG